MNTFAQRAEKINKKYKYASDSPSEKAARDGELFALFEEQEQMKQSMQAQQQGNEFGGGGFDRDYSNTFKNNSFNFSPTFSDFKENNVAPTWEDYYMTKTDKEKAYKENPLLKTFAKSTESESEFSEYTPSSNMEKYLGMASHVVSAAGNLINRNSVDDPKRISPNRVRPTGQARFTDLNPFKTELAEELASTRYMAGQSGADFDTTSRLVTTANNKFSSGLGKVTVEGQNLDNKEMARLDELHNKAAYFNATAENQADIDVAQRQEIADQKRRNYLAALSENFSTLITDERDRLYADRLEPYLQEYGALQGLNATRKS